MVGDRDWFKDLMLQHQLPTGWFAEDGPVINAVLDALATAPAFSFEQMIHVAAQIRLTTATGMNLDLIAEDFFGRAQFRRRTGEADDSYRARIDKERLRPRATKAAMIGAIEDLTGTAPEIFEPYSPISAGTYGRSQYYGKAGRLGSLNRPNEVFLSVTRSKGQGIPKVSGYGANQSAYGRGMMRYVSRREVRGDVTDAEIIRTVSRTVASGVTAWTEIKSGS